MAQGNPLVRPYTPISTNDLKGKFELLVKCYSSGLAKHMDQLQVGETVEFKHIPFNVKTQYPFKKGHIGMIAGGTGIGVGHCHSAIGSGPVPLGHWGRGGDSLIFIFIFNMNGNVNTNISPIISIDIYWMGVGSHWDTTGMPLWIY